MGKQPATDGNQKFDSDESWRADAACKGINPNFFYPQDRTSTEAAKTFCRGCAVREACLAYALAHHEGLGVWGGTTERERVRIRKDAKPR